jgi:nucleoid-associated protein
MPEDNAKRYQKEVAEFCMEQSREGAAVNYRELSGTVDSVAEVSLDDFIAERAPELQEEFIPDRSSLKKYIRYTGRTKEVSISFSNESLGKSITFDPSTDTLTLKELPAALIKQLKGE